MSDLLVLEDVVAGFPGGEDAPVLNGINLSISKGEIAGMASLDVGGGKSTLAKVAAGLLPPWKGRVLFDGVDVYSMGYTADQKFRGRFSVVFEGGALLVNQTVWDNVALPLRYHGDVRGRELKVQVERLLAQCGYNEKLHAYPWQISERSRRLAAFARALARDPEFVIVDRFFEGMEMPDWRRLFELVMELNNSSGVSWLLVSELDPAIFQVAERVCILEKGQVLGFDFRRKLYENPRIRAAFQAAELKAATLMGTPNPSSERILVVDSGDGIDAFSSGASVEAFDMVASGVEDLGRTIDLDGKIEDPWGDQPMTGDDTPDPDATVDLPDLPGEATITLDGKLAPPEEPKERRGRETVTLDGKIEGSEDSPGEQTITLEPSSDSEEG